MPTAEIMPYSTSDTPPITHAGMAGDDRRELRAERQQNGEPSGDAHHARVEDTGEGEHAGVLAVGGVSRRAEQRRHDSGQAVAEQRAVQPRLGDEIAIAGRADGRHVADVLDDGGEGQAA